ncbi:histidine phosphatase family protein [Hydrogenophaga sp. 5NK40-0174]|uniref:histidine phosphatase family protein n=1 Tax=Hydrogenophaga sp. 5NK40-0174 TaxID=3127649 RepID=UPI0031092B40
MDSVTRLLVVRHGETAWNAAARIQGHTDIDLNDTGRWQAERLADALADEDIAAFYASDLARARETARAVADRHGKAVKTTRDLRERCFGEYEGRSWQQLREDHPHESEQWRTRVPDYAPPGGESLVQVRDRVVQALTDIAARHRGEQVLVVAHGGVLDHFYRAATRVDLQAPRSWQLANAAINRLLWSPEGLTLVGWGDTFHLDTGSLDENTV